MPDAISDPIPVHEADWAALNTDTYLHYAYVHIERVINTHLAAHTGDWFHVVVLPARRRAEIVTTPSGVTDQRPVYRATFGGRNVVWGDMSEAPQLAAVRLCAA